MGGLPHDSHYRQTDATISHTSLHNNETKQLKRQLFDQEDISLMIESSYKTVDKQFL